METLIYVIRHCEALGNKLRLFQGSSDFDISELGEIQLKFLSERFKDVQIDRVYSSPLLRAVKTARAVADNKELEVIPYDDLRELSGGVIDGKPIAESFRDIEGLADAWDNHPEDFAPEGGEKMRDAYCRIYSAIMDIAKSNKGERIAVASHGGVIRCLMCRLMYGDINRLKSVPWAENTAVTLLKFDEDFNITVEYFNDRSHVPDEYMPKRSRISEFMKGNTQ